MPELTKPELEKHNGKEGRLSYVAVNGEIYDVSSSPLWGNGDHMGLHSAGGDLTEDLSAAPHGPEVLARVKKIATLAAAPATVQTSPRRNPPAWAASLIALHSHPITVHFPQAFFVFAPFFLVIFYIFGARSFERTAYYLITIAFLMAIPSTATGFLHWWYKFSGRSRPVFRLKIWLSLLLLPASALAFALHTACGELPSKPVNWLVLCLYLAMIPLVTLIGRAGGEIVFGGKGK